MCLCYCAQKTLLEQVRLKNYGDRLHAIYIKSNSSPSIELCRTPHLISFFALSADSVIFIHGLLPFK